jgi:hypothetical protein
MKNWLTGIFTKSASGHGMLTMSGFEIASLMISLVHLGIELWNFFFRDEPGKKPTPAPALAPS